jgi:Ca2+-binding RTX toxin-like protein
VRAVLRPSLTFALVVAALALLAPSLANAAATVEVSGATLKVPLPPVPGTQTTTNGAQVVPTQDGGALVAIYGSTSETMTAGAGCQQVSNSNAPGISGGLVNSGATFTATCSLSGVRLVEGSLRAPAFPPQVWESSMSLPTNVTSTPGVTAAGAAGDKIITGGGGDRITAGDGNDTIDARGAPYKGQEALAPSGTPALDDPNRNIVNGGGGNDTIELSFGTGRDIVTGGAGTDAATYATRFSIGSPGAVGVHVTLDGTANDGDPNIDPPDSTALGEGDNVGTDVENLSGTKRDDRLIGSGVANLIFGDEGVDTLTGNAGEDVVVAREPASAGSGTPDVISCGSPAPPSKSGTSTIGVFTVSGYDRLEADLADVKPADCELLVDMAVDEPAPVAIAKTAGRKAHGKRLHVRLSCPRKAKRTCTGKLRLAGKRSGSKAAKFSLKGGAKRTVRLRLSAAAAAALAKPRSAARLVSNEKGLKGPVNRVAFVRVR